VVREPAIRGDREALFPREVAEQRGTIRTDYVVARAAAEAFYERLRELFARRSQITTFGPYSPGQAVTMKRLGIEAIYLGGWATSAKDRARKIRSRPGELSSQPGAGRGRSHRADAAGRRQEPAFRPRAHDAKQLETTPVVDYRPFIIADADTGHGGDAHVRNLIRRFVEAGIPGFHIEDQKPASRVRHQEARSWCPRRADQAPERRPLPARHHGSAGILVARTDAESATFIDGRGDERDQAFILGRRTSTCRATRSATSPSSRCSTIWGSARLAGTSSTRSPSRIRRATSGSSGPA